MKPASIGIALLWPLRVVRDHQVNLLVAASIATVWFAAWTRSTDLSAPGVRFSLPGLPPPKSLASEGHRSDPYTYQLKNGILQTADVNDTGG